MTVMGGTMVDLRAGKDSVLGSWKLYQFFFKFFIITLTTQLIIFFKEVIFVSNVPSVFV